jgi:hypothetical protein
MKSISIAGLTLIWSAGAFAQGVPQCSDWLKSDRSAASCVCAGAARAGDDRLLACGAGGTKKAAVSSASSEGAGIKIARIEGSAANFDGSAASLPDAPVPQAAAAPAPVFARPARAPSLQKPLDRKLGNDSYLASSVMFHAAGAFDVTSTVVGIKRDPNFHEADPVYLAVFGQKNDRNVGLITAVAVVTHLGAQGISWYLHREANKQGEAGHRVRQYLLDATVAAGNGVGAALHVKEGRTWYRSDGGPL